MTSDPTKPLLGRCDKKQYEHAGCPEDTYCATCGTRSSDSQNMGECCVGSEKVDIDGKPLPAAEPAEKKAGPPTYPKPCHLCGKTIESVEDLDWHGLGNCVEITPEMEAQWKRESECSKYVGEPGVNCTNCGLIAYEHARPEPAAPVSPEPPNPADYEQSGAGLTQMLADARRAERLRDTGPVGATPEPTALSKANAALIMLNNHVMSHERGIDVSWFVKVIGQIRDHIDAAQSLSSPTQPQRQPVGSRPITIEVDRETDGRWIAEFIHSPGVMAYGASPQEAVDKAMRIYRCLGQPVGSKEHK